MTKKKKLGFTLTELLVVIAILALLVLATIVSLSQKRQKAEDTKIKTDLARLKIAFEDYYNDNHCYPPGEWFDGAEDCGSNEMQPYLASITCDAHTGLPYVLEKDASGCGSFKLYGDLALPSSDPQALALCGPSGSTLGNYGVSSSNVVVSIFCGSGALASATPTPLASGTPSPSGQLPPVNPSYSYYCQGASNCTSYDPYKFYCVPAHNDPNCGGGCSEASACVLR